MVKNDREKAVMWATEHWAVSKYVCLCIALVGLMATAMNIMTATAAFVASVLGIVYVLLLTRHYTRTGQNRQEADRS